MIIKERISEEKLKELASDASMVKMAVDIEKGILAAVCFFHMDCAEELIRNGSKNKNLWGANFYPQEKRVDFSAVFNIRPQYNNRAMEIQDPVIKKEVGAVINKLLPI